MKEERKENFQKLLLLLLTLVSIAQGSALLKIFSPLCESSSAVFWIFERIAVQWIWWIKRNCIH